MDARLESAIDNAPKRPGVYIWKDGGGRILYVGKAESLKERLSSYLNPQDLKTARLMEAAASVETVLTASPSEALILEDALVKQNQPRYNVRLKDDKRYPYIKVTAGEDIPRVLVARRVELDGSRYFGPYTDASSVRKVIRLVSRYFGIRQCKKRMTNVMRPCINYSIGECSAPCKVTDLDGYRRRVDGACRFLTGDNKGLVRELKARIRALSAKREFEKAIELRDILRAIESLGRKQDISSARLPDMDILGYAFAEGRANVTQLMVREHRVVSVLHHPLTGEYAGNPAEAMRAFIKQHYTTADLTPRLIVTSCEPADRELLEAVLCKVLGSKVQVTAASRGQKRKLADLAVENSIHQIRQEMLARKAPSPLELLKEIFRLERTPLRIEGYDISNLGKKNNVGGMAVFTEGKPDKSQYRRFAIRGPGQNDPESMAEVMRRRFAHDEWKTPDIVLLDGGKTQLSASLPHIPRGVKVLALAKENEEIHLPGRREPVRLDGENPALRLLQHVRDEAHRFARSYHTLRRGREFIV